MNFIMFSSNRIRRRIASALVVLIAVFSISGCASFSTSKNKSKARPTEEKQLVIPDFPTAKEQYSFAIMYQRSLIISPDMARRQVQMDKVTQCHDRVLKNFPGDQTYAPLAMVAIADANASIGELPTAIEIYHATMAKYPDNEYIQARALFAIARTLDNQGKFQEAKDTYRQVMERFSASHSAAVQDLVRRAQGLYFTVKETIKSKR